MTLPPHPAPEPPPPPPCDLDLLAQFSAGELDAVRRDAVSAHLLDCDRCWAEHDAQRAAIAAVHTLWEPAPVGLRADIRAAIDNAHPQPRRHGRRRVLLAAAAAIVIVGAGGAVADRPAPTAQHPDLVGAAPLPEPIRAAISEAGTPPRSDPTVPTAPDLGAAGLQLTGSGTATAGGIAATRYDYADADGHRVSVFVATQPWPRPNPAIALGTHTWLLNPTAPAAPTVVGGPDDAGDDMLVIAGDHTVTMTVAAQLGLV